VLTKLPQPLAALKGKGGRKAEGKEEMRGGRKGEGRTPMSEVR